MLTYVVHCLTYFPADITARRGHESKCVCVQVPGIVVHLPRGHIQTCVVAKREMRKEREREKVRPASDWTPFPSFMLRVTSALIIFPFILVSDFFFHFLALALDEGQTTEIHNKKRQAKNLTA